jgi:superfamily II DNA/RNA helicase
MLGTSPQPTEYERFLMETDVVLATPGRVVDKINRNPDCIKNLKMIYLYSTGRMVLFCLKK